MTKIETVTDTFEYEHCAECPHCRDFGGSDDYWCTCWDDKTLTLKDKLTDIWGAIPDFCPLPDKEETK